ncbi:hypothetical protein Ahy_A01g002154 isoform B [Arachis hypogaea]|uniref:Uncharacterized protein n=1 Tax=Arachis hypogaea TaxID=3818 RepID=A0A445EQP4_ARAHY|nr:hypothetical protein Ahy_A01g002154 isoform B [Arachis hypogaea]
MEIGEQRLLSHFQKPLVRREDDKCVSFLFAGGRNLICKAVVVQRVPYTIMVGCLLWTKSPLSSHSLCPRINDEGKPIYTCLCVNARNCFIGTESTEPNMGLSL